eukprot:1560260-Amphidinium_carterae.1
MVSLVAKIVALIIYRDSLAHATHVSVGTANCVAISSDDCRASRGCQQKKICWKSPPSPRLRSTNRCHTCFLALSKSVIDTLTTGVAGDAECEWTGSWRVLQKIADLLGQQKVPHRKLLHLSSRGLSTWKYTGMRP